LGDILDADIYTLHFFGGELEQWICDVLPQVWHRSSNAASSNAASSNAASNNAASSNTAAINAASDASGATWQGKLLLVEEFGIQRSEGAFRTRRRITAAMSSSRRLGVPWMVWELGPSKDPLQWQIDDQDDRLWAGAVVPEVTSINKAGTSDMWNVSLWNASLPSREPAPSDSSTANGGSSTAKSHSGHAQPLAEL
jgi:hypothetical protein